MFQSINCIVILYANNVRRIICCQFIQDASPPPVEAYQFVRQPPGGRFKSTLVTTQASRLRFQYEDVENTV